MPKQSLRRNPALIPLSHDHHDGLKAAVELRRGHSAFPGEHDKLQSVVRLWDEQLNEHFREEELVLFSREWPDHVGTLVAQALEEHATMRSIVESIQTGNADDSTAQRFGALLEAHIRMEERQLFEAMQSVLTADELKDIGTALRAERTSKEGGGSED
jgi:hemerythrin-like domain-containing protein